MPKIGFTDEMLDTLRSMKGKTFKSYECHKEASNGSEYAFKNLRINLGRSVVDLRCTLELVEDYVGGPDEVATLSCEVADPKSPFVPYFGERAVAYMVDERIRGVELVRDHVVYRNTKNRETCTIDMDVALLVHTKYHTFCFSVYLYFADEICISVTAPEDTNFDITPTSKLWLGGPDLTVEASRELVRL